MIILSEGKGKGTVATDRHGGCGSFYGLPGMIAAIELSRGINWGGNGVELYRIWVRRVSRSVSKLDMSTYLTIPAIQSNLSST